MRAHSYAVVDVFTDRPLEGNPVAVFLDASDLTDEVMQRTARELNLSETVFVLPPDGDEDAHIRIFTPTAELPFAGHPVLGTAFVLGERLRQPLIRLGMAAGLVPVELRFDDDRIVFGEMEQPIPEPERFDAERELLAALHVDRAALPVSAYRHGPVHVYVCLDDEQDVAALRPDLSALEDIGPFCFSCVAGTGARFKSRMFAPGLGVAEDPATGSAAGALALHLARHGVIAFGQRIEIHQGAEIGRPSVLHARVEGAESLIERVLVGGSAVIVARGEYELYKSSRWAPRR